MRQNFSLQNSKLNAIIYLTSNHNSKRYKTCFARYIQSASLIFLTGICEMKERCFHSIALTVINILTVYYVLRH